MKIFLTSQIAELDKYTIEHEPIESIDLMERAANRIFQKFKQQFLTDRKVLVLAGPGNNGGDGLALGRMLLQEGFETKVILLHSGKLSEDCHANKMQLEKQFPQFFSEQINRFEAPQISKNEVIVDALFGSGLSRPLANEYKEAVLWMNALDNEIVAIDVPSGLSGEACESDSEAITKANFTYTLQFPKLAMFFAENENYLGEWSVLDIQLHPKGIEETESNYHFLEKKDVSSFLRNRKRFAHKGNFGNLLIWGGSKGMVGAVFLSAKAALRSGAGLVFVHTVAENREIIQSSLPEAIFKETVSPVNNYSNLLIGPGLGTDSNTEARLIKHIQHYSKPLVLDADALNLLAKNYDFLYKLPKNSILTPHPKEFERLFGKTRNSKERMEKAGEMAQRFNIIIVLKGANTLIASPDGKFYFNSTGNPGMAVGGMGDVLAGIIAGLQSQGVEALESALLGVYLHGLAADLALEKQSYESLLPSDVIDYLGKAFIEIRNEKQKNM